MKKKEELKMINKSSMKINAADTVSNFTEGIRTFLQNYDPEEWRQATDCLQKTFLHTSEFVLEIMFGEIGWND